MKKFIMSPLGAILASLSITSQPGGFSKMMGIIGILFSIACILANLREGQFKKRYYIIEIIIVIIGISIWFIIMFGNFESFIGELYQNPVNGAIPFIGAIIYFSKYQILRKKEIK